MKSFLTTALTATALSFGATNKSHADHLVTPSGTSVVELESSGTVANALRASGAQIIDIIPDSLLSLSPGIPLFVCLS